MPCRIRLRLPSRSGFHQYVPYAAVLICQRMWLLLFLILHNVFFYANIYSDVYGWKGIVSHLYGIKESLFCAAKIVIAMNETEQLLGGYWFIKELFIGAFVSLLVFKFVKNLYFGGVLLLLTIGLSFTDFEVPFFHICSRSFLESFFIVMGRCYKLWGI